LDARIERGEHELHVPMQALKAAGLNPTADANEFWQGIVAEIDAGHDASDIAAQSKAAAERLADAEAAAVEAATATAAARATLADALRTGREADKSEKAVDAAIVKENHLAARIPVLRARDTELATAAAKARQAMIREAATRLHEQLQEASAVWLSEVESFLIAKVAQREYRMELERLAFAGRTAR
jgi:hypothetical protein